MEESLQHRLFNRNLHNIQNKVPPLFWDYVVGIFGKHFWGELFGKIDWGDLSGKSRGMIFGEELLEIKLGEILWEYVLGIRNGKELFGYIVWEKEMVEEEFLGKICGGKL